MYSLEKRKKKKKLNSLKKKKKKTHQEKKNSPREKVLEGRSRSSRGNHGDHRCCLSTFCLPHVLLLSTMRLLLLSSTPCVAPAKLTQRPLPVTWLGAVERPPFGRAPEGPPLREGLPKGTKPPPSSAITGYPSCNRNHDIK